MNQKQINITLETKSGGRVNFIANIQKGMFEEYKLKGFKIISVQY